MLSGRAVWLGAQQDVASCAECNENDVAGGVEQDEFVEDRFDCVEPPVEHEEWQHRQAKAQERPAREAREGGKEAGAEKVAVAIGEKLAKAKL